MDAAALPAEEVLTSADGVSIVARHFRPADPPWAAVLIAPAMGMVARHYEAFAVWLAAQGAAVLSFDYRGMGASRFGRPLRGFAADLDLWRIDQDAALNALADRHPGLPVLLLGHSLGAQQAAALPSAARLSGLLGVSMGSGYLGDLRADFRPRSRLFLYGIGPLAMWVCGYFPGERLRIVGDVPLGAMRQWRRWCLTPGYLLDAEQRRPLYRAARFPVISLKMSDDEMLAESGFRMLFEAHGNPRRFAELPPAPGEHVGHTGIFRSRHRDTQWPHLLAALKELT
ncbi:alpha/beta fold hydrolase [Inhella sp.]|uniref:alpha/beta hydrolase family protein n=1 Tax=Inhella sp. TaxID=1921806 RepID=UPI0035AE515B